MSTIRELVDRFYLYQVTYYLYHVCIQYSIFGAQSSILTHSF